MKLPWFTWEPRKRFLGQDKFEFFFHVLFLFFLPVFAAQVEMTLDPAQSGYLDSREGQGLFSRWD